MFRSIRWTLQLWHALLLLVVVCIFGATLYLRLRHARFQSIDAELQGSAEVLSARLRPVFPPRSRRDDDGDGRGRPERGPETRPANEPPPRRDGGRRGPPGEWDPAFVHELERRLEVPGFMMRRYEGEEPAGHYFIIWQAGGHVVRASRPDLQVPAPPDRVDPFAPAPPVFRQRGRFREVIVPGPFTTQVLVGRSIANEQRELRQLMGLLAVTGLVVLGVGLLGGWWLSTRAIRPIQAITSTAQSISATNLSRRIGLEQTKSELGALADVLNAMFARLEAAFDRQIRFTADASHELRTPLSIIYSHAELALAKPRTADEYRETIETCFRASRRMKGLVESLLVLARADAGKLQIKREPFDLMESAQECVELVAPLAAEKNVQVRTELAPTPMTGDTFRIAQVITNLLSNAINYNRDGGSVTISVRPENGHALLAVCDTGVGIAPEDQKHLFERFYRVDKARSRELGGTGLGLAICKSIVEAHGGAICFTSAVNQGTTFTIRLPRGTAVDLPDAARAR